MTTKHQLLQYLVDTGQISYWQYLREDIKASFDGWPWYKIVGYFAGIVIVAFVFWFVGVCFFA